MATNFKFKEIHIQLKPGGSLLLYSDGINETMNIHGTEFGLDSLGMAMQSNRKNPPQEVCRRLWQDVQAFGGNQPQQDDFTAVIVSRVMD